MPRRPKPIDQQLRDAIAQAERRGITRYRLAKLSGVAERNVGMIANGDTIPRLDTADKLVRALGGTFRIELTG